MQLYISKLSKKVIITIISNKGINKRAETTLIERMKINKTEIYWINSVNINMIPTEI